MTVSSVFGSWDDHHETELVYLQQAQLEKNTSSLCASFYFLNMLMSFKKMATMLYRVGYSCFNPKVPSVFDKTLHDKPCKKNTSAISMIIASDFPSSREPPPTATPMAGRASPTTAALSHQATTAPSLPKTPPSTVCATGSSVVRMDLPTAAPEVLPIDQLMGN